MPLIRLQICEARLEGEIGAVVERRKLFPLFLIFFSVSVEIIDMCASGLERGRGGSLVDGLWETFDSQD